ncbi:MAG: hypothetical protein HOJ63_03250 [Flavobacteriaceae bacterium]|nr:hypothetical protein [Flavobacteriaceae bacterium]
MLLINSALAEFFVYKLIPIIIIKKDDKLSEAILVGIYTGTSVSIGVALWLTLRNKKKKIL